MATWRRISQLLFSAIAPDIFGGLGKGAAAGTEIVVVIAVIIEALGDYYSSPFDYWNTQRLEKIMAGPKF